jgi:hypothetical protein
MQFSDQREEEKPREVGPEQPLETVDDGRPLLLERAAVRHQQPGAAAGGAVAPCAVHAAFIGRTPGRARSLGVRQPG